MIEKKLALKLSAAAVAMALSASAGAFSTVQVNFSGGGVAGAVEADKIDWFPSNLLFQGITPTPTAGTTNFNLLGQAIGSFQFNNSNINPAGVEITYVFGVNADATRATLGTTDTIAYQATATSNGYFEVWLDSNPLTAANNLAGTGFNDGVLILSGVFNPQDDISTLTNARGCVTAGTCANLDQFDSDGPGGVPTDNYLGLLKTTKLSGSTSFTIDVTFQDTNYIINDITTFNVNGQDASLNQVSTDTPFMSVDPSLLFRNATNTAPVAPIHGGTAGGPALPPGVFINGNACVVDPCDIHVTSDQNTVFDAGPTVPEPGSLALLGLGLGLAGFSALRRRKLS